MRVAPFLCSQFRGLNLARWGRGVGFESTQPLPPRRFCTLVNWPWQGTQLDSTHRMVTCRRSPPPPGLGRCQPAGAFPDADLSRNDAVKTTEGTTAPRWTQRETSAGRDSWRSSFRGPTSPSLCLVFSVFTVPRWFTRRRSDCIVPAEERLFPPVPSASFRA